MSEINFLTTPDDRARLLVHHIVGPVVRKADGLRANQLIDSAPPLFMGTVQVQVLAFESADRSESLAQTSTAFSVVVDQTPQRLPWHQMQHETLVRFKVFLIPFSFQLLGFLALRELVDPSPNPRTMEPHSPIDDPSLRKVHLVLLLVEINPVSLDGRHLQKPPFDGHELVSKQAGAFKRCRISGSWSAVKMTLGCWPGGAACRSVDRSKVSESWFGSRSP